MESLTCFNNDGICGIVGQEVNEFLAFRVGYAMAKFTHATCLVVGGDNRLSTNSLRHCVIDGIRNAGVNVIDIGLCGREEIYFATTHSQCDGGIMITGGELPKQFNGIKLVKKDSSTMTIDDGLLTIKTMVESYEPTLPKTPGKMVYQSYVKPYIKHIMSFTNLTDTKPMRIVVNAGNGTAGHIVNAIEAFFITKRIPIELIKLNNQPDGDFPMGVPNPTIEQQRKKTSDAVRAYHADFAVAWDNDFNRCFFFDDQGSFIDNHYMVALLAQSFLLKEANKKIVHDPKLTWDAIETNNMLNDNAKESVTTHAAIKDQMKAENAVYGGAADAHHYFRDFFYCDSGMIPWLMVIELISSSKLRLHELVNKEIKAYPSSQHINGNVDNMSTLLEPTESALAENALCIKHLDGLAMTLNEWGLNIEPSQKQSVIKLNVESRGNVKLLRLKTALLLDSTQGMAPA